MADNLCTLQFYVLELDKFGLTEELYIKMNARGLALTPFENFKADLVGFYKPDEKTAANNELGDWLRFATDLDTRWIDLFWNKADDDEKTFNNKFFRFFYRHCAIITFLQDKKDAREFTGDKNEFYTFFDSKSEEQSIEGVRYYGFEYYRVLMQNNKDFNRDITKILNTILNNQDCIYKQLNTQWGDKYSLFDDRTKYTQKTAIIFAAITQFILNYDDFDVDNYNRWMRIVNNIVENANIDGVVRQINITRNLVDILNKDRATENIYTTLKNEFLVHPTQVIAEEAGKAKFIIENPKYETVFQSLEKGSFFKGFAEVVISPNVDLQTLNNRIERITPLFDIGGVSSDYRKEHLLIRAMIASINKWEGGLKELRITEKVNSDMHLKALLRNDQVKSKLQYVLDSDNDIPEALHNIINNHKIDPNFNGGLDETKVVIAYDNLCTNIKLHDWIAEHTTAAKSIVIKERDGHIKVRVPGAWYNKVYIDYEFDNLIDNFISNNSFEFLYDFNATDYKTYGFVPGDSIELTKEIDGIKLQISFNYYLSSVTFSITNATKKDINNIIKIWPDAKIDNIEKIEISRFKDVNDNNLSAITIGMLDAVKKLQQGY